MTLDSSLQYEIYDDKQKYQGVVKNLSATGILFTTGESLPLGIQLQIKLTPENNITPPMSAEVQVTRCDKHADAQYHVAGVMTEIK
jgi:hypothetical protein